MHLLSNIQLLSEDPLISEFKASLDHSTVFHDSPTFQPSALMGQGIDGPSCYQVRISVVDDL